MCDEKFNFDKLIWPMDKNTFLSEYWEQNLLILSRKEDYYSSLFSINNMNSILYSIKHKDTDIRIFKNGQTQKHNYVSNKTIFSLNQIYSAYYEGNTIILDNLKYYWTPIANFIRNLEVFLNQQVDASVLLTPNNSQGFGVHFDTVDVFVLQIEGSKLWRIYNPFLSLPMVENQQPVPDNKLGEPLHEVCLNPGDLLYIPRGYVHEALTSECCSLHISLQLHPFRWADLISNALMLVSEENVSFRKSLPIGFLDPGEKIEFLRHRFEELLEVLSNSARIESAIDRLAKRFLEDMATLPDGDFIQVNDVNSINLDTIVEKREGMICKILKEEGSVSILFPGNVVKYPNYVEPALCFIADSEKFPIKSIPANLTDNGKLFLVRHLVKKGLLRVIHKE